MKRLFVLLAWVPTVMIGFPVILLCIFAVIVAEKMGWLEEFDECDCVPCRVHRSIMGDGQDGWGS